MAQLAYVCDSSEAAEFSDDAPPVRVSAFADVENCDDSLSDQARELGLAVGPTRPLRSLLEGDGLVLGDLVLVECTAPGGAELAALVRLDQRAARAGAKLLVSVTAGALEDVFGCLETAQYELLVDAGPAQRAVALGALVVGAPANRVREIDRHERLALARLTEEVGRLAAKLDRLALPLGQDGEHSMTARLASPGMEHRDAGRERDLLRRPRAPLPDPRLIQRIIRQRRLRQRYFESELFADPAWNILLDLTAARAEHRRVSVTSLCIAAAVPATTALRWIAQMTDMGLLVRVQDDEDKRRAFIALSDSAAESMARYFDELGKEAAKQV